MTQATGLIAVDTRTTEVSDMKRVMGWASLHGPNQVSNPQTEDRAVLGFIEAGPAGGHGNQKTIQVVQKGVICSRVPGFVNAWVVNQLTQLGQTGGIGHRAGDLMAQASQMGGDGRPDIATTDNSESKPHGDASGGNTM